MNERNKGDMGRAVRTGPFTWAYPDFKKSDEEVYSMQALRGVHGSFKQKLFEAMLAADDQNLERFKAAFPADWARFVATFESDPDELNKENGCDEYL